MIRLLTVFMLGLATVYGQPDSYQENPEAVYKKRTLLKVGASLPILRQSSFTGYYAALTLDATVEQKVYKGLTVLGGVDITGALAMDGRATKFYSLEMPLALRYYFSLTRRQKQRTDRHSFFSPYVALQTHNVLFNRVIYSGSGLTDLAGYYRGRVLRPETNGGLIKNGGRVGDGFTMLDYAYLQVGSQHQVFNKRGYLDINVLVPVRDLIYSKGEYTLSTPGIINVKLGYNLTSR
ncbi:hypothetical protein [Larkinella arboricola]|nr:hypothetical protein [Larkinella arboricola]